MASGSAVEQRSSYDSIILDAEGTKWSKISDHPLEELYRKFWRQGARGWPGNDFMNVDQDEDEDEEYDIGPGCGTLDIDIPDIGRSKLWIRNEYIRLYKYCDDYLESRRNKHMPPSVVITGQPGIGKSIWILYAICRRLTEGKPVIWFRAKKRYLFIDDGIFVEPLCFPHHPATDFRTRVWTFVDADEESGVTGVPEHLAVHDSKHLIIYTSSPRSERWKGLGKTSLCRVAIMNPWTRAEISQAATIHGLEAEDPRIDKMYYQFGPTPRICFDFLHNEALRIVYETRHQDALNNLSLAKLDDLVLQGAMLSLDVRSHTVLLIRRLPRWDLIHAKRDLSDGSAFSYGSTELITRAVELELRKHLWNVTQDVQVSLYKRLESIESTRRIAGLVFEALAQKRFQNNIRLNLVRMATRQLDGAGQGTKLPRWHSNNVDGANSFSLHIRAKTTEIYPEPGPGDIKPMVYYVPEAPNQVAFDSFIMADGKLFIFQFTIGSDHPIMRGIVPFFSRYTTLPQEENWYFVFVIPSGPKPPQVSCPQPRDPELKDLLCKMNLFSAVVDPQAREKWSLFHLYVHFALYLSNLPDLHSSLGDYFSTPL